MHSPARLDGKLQIDSEVEKFLAMFLLENQIGRFGFVKDQSGIETDAEFTMQQSQEVADEPKVKPPVPRREEELFEWLDLAECVLYEQEPLVFVELGAGFGRWAVRFLRMAAYARKAVEHLYLVEAERNHANWARQHLIYSGVPVSSFSVIEAAVSHKRGWDLFVDQMPKGSVHSAANEWYGQSLLSATGMSRKHVEKTSNWRWSQPRAQQVGKNWGTSRVRTLRLGDLARGTTRISLMDLDIQNSEAKVIRSGIRTLNNRVSRLHIGTHSEEVERQILDILGEHGWTLVRNLPGRRKAIVEEFGEIDFQDGVQTWHNPRLSSV